MENCHSDVRIIIPVPAATFTHEKINMYAEEAVIGMCIVGGGKRLPPNLEIYSTEKQFNDGLISKSRKLLRSFFLIFQFVITVILLRYSRDVF